MSEIEQEFAKAKNFIEVAEIADSLKKRGFDVFEINKYNTLRRKQLIQESSRVKSKITTHKLDVEIVNPSKMSHVKGTITNLSVTKLQCAKGGDFNFS